MKKLFILMMFVLSFCLVACKEEVEQTKLSTPVVSISEDGLASWKMVDGASGYVYKITDEALYTTDLFVKLNDGESIIVKAVGDVTLYTDSDYSEKVTYNAPQPEPTKLQTPVVTIDENGVASWENIQNASGYTVSVNGSETTITDLKITLNDKDEIKVKAVGDGVLYLDSEYSNVLTYNAPVIEKPVELEETTVYVVGDSTVCSFNDSTYFYPRYGYGTQLANYFSDKVTFKNYALSGRSSKSFTSEGNYQIILNSIKEGDYLLIGFGHNDEKSDDATRFTDASKPLSDPTSFKYSLYENYIKVAIEKGATPILCTPVVRANSKDDYSGSHAHITDNGDYRKAIIELGEEKNVTVIDLTSITKERYLQIGYNVAIYYHAMTAGKIGTDGSTIVANTDSFDTTHLNIYGAKYVAYMFSKALKESSSYLGNYVLEDINEPVKDVDLVQNPSYEYKDYSAPNLNTYNAPEHFSTISDGWYGTAFGDCGGTPSSSGNGYVAQELSKGTFEVGQSAASNKGKFADAGDGFAYLFKQVSVEDNFKLTVEATITSAAGTKQAGFGLMLRDDCFINQNTSKVVVTSNYLTAGILQSSDTSMNMLFYRENGKLVKSSNSLSGTYKIGDAVTMSIERVGQSITTTLVYNGVTYTKTYYDFDLVAVDSNYMYIGMFANRGTIVEFTNVNFTITGTSQGA